MKYKEHISITSMLTDGECEQIEMLIAMLVNAKDNLKGKKFDVNEMFVEFKDGYLMAFGSRKATDEEAQDTRIRRLVSEQRENTSKIKELSKQISELRGDITIGE